MQAPEEEKKKIGSDVDRGGQVRDIRFLVDWVP